MAKHIEGTLTLDGLLEGTLPADSNISAQINNWLRFASDQHIQFHLETHGDHFSILADNTPLEINQLKSPVEPLLIELLQQFVNIFPREHQVNILSTIRSCEYKKNYAIQIIYSLTPSGKINTHSREAETETEEPKKPLSRREKTGLILIGSMAIVVSLLISAFFIDYRIIFKNFQEEFTTLNPEELVIKNEIFASYLEVNEITKKKGNKIMLTINSTAHYPRTEAVLEEIYLKSEGLREKLTAEALARGYIYYDLFDKEKKFMRRGVIRVKPLNRTDGINLIIPYNNNQKPRFIELCY